MRDFSLPPTESLLQRFSERHHIVLTDLMKNETVAIQSSSRAQILTSYGYTKLDETALEDTAVDCCSTCLTGISNTWRAQSLRL
jgi:hypothetical protein